MTSNSTLSALPLGDPMSDGFVIGIGTSAGGLEALKLFFDHVPSDCPHSFVVVQHLSPDYKSLMAELLTKNTRLPIHEVRENMPIDPGSIYLIPAKKNLTITADRVLHLEDKPNRNELNLPIDIFFDSLAEALGDRSIAVVLTGTGSDGSRGIRSIKEAGGMSVAQSPETAKFDGMPSSAVATGYVDYVLPIEQMPEEIFGFIDAYSAADSDHARQFRFDRGLLPRILNRVRTETGNDFSFYRRPTLLRRILRRMSLLKFDSAEAYVEHLDLHPAERQTLGSEFLIGVTRFFRNREAWGLLEEKVLPALVKERSAIGPLKVWSVGCSTGEEAYSIAILFHEFMTRSDRPLEVKVFATDVDEGHIERAGRGLFSDSVVEDVSPERLEKYFVRTSTGYRVKDVIRRMVIFSRHNALTSPPFIKIDLILCRNLLIYLELEFQKKLLSTFCYSLNGKGVLFLGSSETLGALQGQFTALSRKWRVYRNRQDDRHPSRAVSNYPDAPYIGQVSPTRHGGRGSNRDFRFVEALASALIDHSDSVAVYVNGDFDILHAMGEYKEFLDLPAKQFSINLLKMLPQNLATTLSLALRKAAKNEEQVRLREVRLKKNDQMHFLDILIQPISIDTVEPSFIVIFRVEYRMEAPEAPEPPSGQQEERDLRILELEEDLKETRENLQATVEELETSNEELQATNEELLSSNEELQSTNEELQSVNEELHTVNAEHQLRITDLATLNDDIDNLLKSTEIGTIFLDREMRVRKFTPAIRQQFNLGEHDIHRPITHFTTRFGEADSKYMLERSQEVMQSGKAFVTQLQAEDGRWYLKRIHPFIDSQDEVAGVVISFIQIDELKETEQKLKAFAVELQQSNQELEEFAYAASHDLQEPLRTISNYVQLLERKLSNSLSEEQRRYMRHTLTASARMSDLIEGLLNYSRMRNESIDFQEISLDAVCDAVIQGLESSIRAAGARITRDKLPVVSGSAVLMEQLLQNLLSNAIKYQAEESVPEIHIGARRGDGDWSIFVRDNGIGIPEKSFDEIFQIFRRLHTRDEYEGTGIGLAICNKIVALHGGRLQVKSEVGAGSVFHFTLPERTETT